MIKYFILMFLIISVNGYSPVDNLEINKYIGRWYQVYQDLADTIFEGKSTCIIADYGLKNDSTISVVNSETTVKGDLQQIRGIAYYQDGNSGGELTVKLGLLPPAPYWVIDLGPIINDQYQYSIVSDNKKKSLFVLARNVSEFFKKYDDLVLDTLEDFNFINCLNKPIKSNQDNCTYPKVVWQDILKV